MRVSGLWIYPIKSCRGIAVERARVARRGFEDDRRYMLVDDEGRFITQRDERRLALVDVSLSSGALLISAPGMPELSIAPKVENGERLAVEVWSSSTEGVVEPAASRWFCELLGRACRLVYMPDDVERGIEPGRSGPDDIVGFQDAYPFLMISEASLADLERRAGVSVSMSRFRPNIVIADCAAFAEDRLSSFTLGDVRFDNAKPCARCVVTTIDPLTGEASKEPLATLASYRKTDDGVMFGVNLIHRRSGWLCVGDALRSGLTTA